MGKLTDKEIRTWIKNDDRFEAKGDGDGLWLRYRESDKSPVWFMRFKIAKIEQKLIIGRYPDMTLVRPFGICHPTTKRKQLSPFL